MSLRSFSGAPRDKNGGRNPWLTAVEDGRGEAASL